MSSFYSQYLWKNFASHSRPNKLASIEKQKILTLNNSDILALASTLAITFPAKYTNNKIEKIIKLW